MKQLLLILYMEFLIVKKHSFIVNKKYYYTKLKNSYKKRYKIKKIKKMILLQSNKFNKKNYIKHQILNWII